MECSKSFEEKFARICQVTHTDKDAALAKILGIKAPSVAAAKRGSKSYRMGRKIAPNMASPLIGSSLGAAP